MRKLIDIPGTDPAAAALLETGLFPSLPANQQKLWLDGQNVLFYDQAAEKAKGIGPIGSSDQIITGMAQAYVDGKTRAYLGTPGKLLKYEDGETSELGSGYTGAVWSMVPWGTWLIATNNSDPVQVCKDTPTAVALANVPVAKARIVRKLAQRPILFAGQTAYWPRATDIEYWTVPDATGNAGNQFIRDLDSDIIAVEPLGERLAFYTENKMGLIEFIGGASVYGFKIRLEGLGAIGINAVIPVGALHFGLARDGIWRTDGSAYAYIDNPAINRYIDASLDPERGDSVVGVHVKDKTMVQWYFPDDGDVIRGIGINYKSGSWHKLEMPVTAALPQEVFDKPLAAAGLDWGLYDDGNNIGAAAMPSLLQSGGFDAGEKNRYKWWDAVELRLEGSAVEVRFGLHQTEVMGATGTDEWLPWVNAQRVNWVQRESPYITMQLRTTALNAAWRLGGLTVHGEMGGWVE